jgi:hypothetical protein
VSAGYPDWVTQTEQTDRDSASTGCAVLYLYWLRSMGFSTSKIVQAGGATLAVNYKTLTGQETAHADLKGAVEHLNVTSDNPFHGLFETRILETGTTFGEEQDGTWLMADYDRDGIPDLVFIKTANTGRGTVEVHIASGASKYQKRILETGTTFGLENDRVWLMADYDRDGIPDLVFIKTANVGTGTVEVHVAV